MNVNLGNVAWRGHRACFHLGPPVCVNSPLALKVDVLLQVEGVVMIWVSGNLENNTFKTSQDSFNKFMDNKKF